MGEQKYVVQIMKSDSFALNVSSHMLWWFACLIFVCFFVFWLYLFIYSFKADTGGPQISAGMPIREQIAAALAGG